jgi:hypothetical protein
MSADDATGKLPMLYDRRIQSIMKLVDAFPNPRAGFTKEEHIVQMTVMFCDEFAKKAKAAGLAL